MDSNKFNLIINPLYKEKQISEEYVKKTDLNIVNKVKKYKTEDLYIKYEKKEYEYLDDYYLEALDGYKLDLESEKEFYYSRKRDKVEINDYLIINKNDMKLEDFHVDIRPETLGKLALCVMSLSSVSEKLCHIRAEEQIKYYFTLYTERAPGI